MQLVPRHGFQTLFKKEQHLSLYFKRQVQCHNENLATQSYQAKEFRVELVN